MQLSQILDKLMRDNNASAYKIGKATGISDRLIGYWRSGEKLPGAENLLTIANYFGTSVDYLLTGKEKSLSSKLSEDKLKLIECYDKLPEKEQQRLIGRAETLAEIYKERVEIPIEPEIPMIEMRHSYYKVSAGTGYDLNDEDQWDSIEIPDTPEAQRSDFCLTISGNSMEPIYYDGDIVLIKAQPAVNNGEIGIFIIENAGYIKKFGGDRLISLNAEYDDILFSDYDPEEIHCVGLVIGRV